MTGTKRLAIILIAAMLAAYAPMSQRGAACGVPAVKSSAGEKDAAGVRDTDQQAEYKITIKKEGKKLTLKKEAEEEIVRLVEEALATPACQCGLPWERLESFEKYGMVIKVEYLAGKKLNILDQHTLRPFYWEVKYINVLADEEEKYLAGNDGNRRYMTSEIYEKILACMKSEYIISEEPLDFTAPKTNIKNGKAYKPGKKITFSDEGSGMKSAKLDGRKIKNGHVVKKKGKHKLVLTDKAGNRRTVKFKIKYK